ncbi:DUF4916 domain-containing protein [Methylomonas paludis]|uniref:DUF4916 domain-containing protein n=1 Tax=Methylomonas paludis TaxID=1173101 RepID=A0A975MQI1_9GAMM|nr:DUF4916 domain-containing protein [Methylomonas paludis]QWF71666.1 DUF4916 domain-containing protein [Methylomonas paludis]
MSKSPAKSSYWLPDDEWQKVQKCLPITCVDILAFRKTATDIGEIGLIKRNTPHQGRKWCLIGGRLQYNETLMAAVQRELLETLGEQCGYSLTGNGQPLWVAQYFPTLDWDEYLDPRQHAISLIYAVELSGQLIPSGEAFEFDWFAVKDIEQHQEIGFGQNRLILDCVAALRKII